MDINFIVCMSFIHFLLVSFCCVIVTVLSPSCPFIFVHYRTTNEAEPNQIKKKKAKIIALVFALCVSNCGGTMRTKPNKINESNLGKKLRLLVGSVAGSPNLMNVIKNATVGSSVARQLLVGHKLDGECEQTNDFRLLSFTSFSFLINCGHCQINYTAKTNQRKKCMLDGFYAHISVVISCGFHTGTQTHIVNGLEVVQPMTTR